MSTASIEHLPNGMTCVCPNRVTTSHPDFYVSFNRTDSAIYGCATTAVVVGQMQRFYVLSGDHEKALAGKPFAECLAYLHGHAEQLNKYSEPLPPLGSSTAEILAAPRMRRTAT